MSKLLVDDLPESADQRNIVVILSDQDVARSRDEGEARFLVTSPQTCFLRYSPNLAEPSPLLRTIISKGQYRAGLTLILNPFDRGSYQVLDKAAEDAVVKKAISFSLLCGYLGARSVVLQRASFEVGEQKFAAKCEAGIPQIKSEVSAEVGFSRAKSLSERLRLSDTYAGGEPDIAKAEHFLRDTGLDADPVASSLLLMRKDGILIKSRSFKLDVTQEVNSSLHLALNMKIPKFIKSDSGINYDGLKKMDVELEISVEF
jgi:hypothetical protein